MAAASATLFGDVLCAIDGTRASFHAVGRACELLAPEGRMMVLVCKAEAGSGRWTAATVGEARAQRALAQAQELASASGVTATAALARVGAPSATVVERARSHTLLAVGPPALSRGAGLMLGGVALHALHNLPVSLLVARGRPLADGERVLLAFDGTEDPPALAQVAAEAAHRLRRGIVAVHCIGAESRSRHHRIESAVAELRERSGIDVELAVEPDHAAGGILRVARSRGATLIVMGSRRVGGVRALGSVSERVAHRAECSVLVVRPEER